MINVFMTYKLACINLLTQCFVFNIVTTAILVLRYLEFVTTMLICKVRYYHRISILHNCIASVMHSFVFVLRRLNQNFEIHQNTLLTDENHIHISKSVKAISPLLLISLNSTHHFAFCPAL